MAEPQHGRFNIKFSKHRRNSRCPVNGSILAGEGWGVFLGQNAQLSDEAARAVAPALAAIAASIAGSTADEQKFCTIVAPTFPLNQIHPLTGAVVQRRDPYEIALLNGNLLGVAQGEDQAPALAAALHMFYGTTPAPRVTPPAESTTTSADKQTQRRPDVRQQVRELIGRALEPDPACDLDSRAELILTAFAMLSQGER